MAFLARIFGRQSGPEPKPLKICFFDIETIPTDQSLRDNGISGTEIISNQADIIKKLSMSAANARILCLGYAIEPEHDSPVEVLSGAESDILERFWQLAADCHLFVGHNI